MIALFFATNLRVFLMIFFQQRMLFPFDRCLYVGVYAGLCLPSAASISVGFLWYDFRRQTGSPSHCWKTEAGGQVSYVSRLLISAEEWREFWGSTRYPLRPPLAVYERPILGPVWPLLTTEGDKVTIGVSWLPSGYPLTSTWRGIWGSCHRWVRRES